MSLKYVRTSLGEKGLPVEVFFCSGESDGLAQLDDRLGLRDVLHPNRLGRKLEHLRDRHSHDVDEGTVHADDLRSSQHYREVVRDAVEQRATVIVDDGEEVETALLIPVLRVVVRRLQHPPDIGVAGQIVFLRVCQSQRRRTAERRGCRVGEESRVSDVGDLDQLP